MAHHFILRILLYCSVCGLLYVGVAAGVVWKFKDGLPSFTDLEQVEPSQTTNIFAADGVALRKYFIQRRVPITYDRLAQSTVDALIATEDRNFWRHWGVSLPDIFWALLRNILREGRLKGHGASTVTQQLARNLFDQQVGREVTWSRKIREQLTAVLLERTYTKKEIIEKYFNQMLFGRGAYGIQAAANRFFGKDAADLTVDESALLVGLLRGPYYYSPDNHPNRASERRDYVLDVMRGQGKISPSEHRLAKQRPIMLHSVAEEAGEAPYFTEYIRQHIEKTHGLDVLYNGASVYTTLDSRVQRIAEEELQKQVKEIQKDVENQWRRNPPDSTFWAGIDTREDTLAATVVQCALMALDPHSGHILAMVGGRDFKESKFNRAVQAMRQPGSAFKPFIYTAAIDSKIPPTKRYPDTAVSIQMEDGSFWQPENYDRRFLGWMTMREGLSMSRNVVTTKLLEEIGPRVAVRYAKRMGISTPVLPVRSLGMGTSEVTLIDLVSSFGVFPNGGIRAEPVAVLKVVDRDGNILEARVRGAEHEVLSAESAAVMTSMLQSVMDLNRKTDRGDLRRGTGYGARANYGFRRPAAGKTGTTQNFADAWFVGFTPQIVAGVWIGFDSKVSLGNRKSGAVVALPVWARFMKRVHEELGLEEEGFVIPQGVVQMEVCEDTYQVASIYCPKRYKELFVPGSEPKTPCAMHTSGKAAAPQENSKKKRRRDYHF